MQDTAERRHSPNNQGRNQFRRQRPAVVANALQFKRTTNHEPNPDWSAQHGGPPGLLLARCAESRVEEVSRDGQEHTGYFQLCVNIRVRLQEHTNHGVNDGENEADVGREYGEAWAQDHRRMAVGRSSLLRHRTGNTAWR